MGAWRPCGHSNGSARPIASVIARSVEVGAAVPAAVAPAASAEMLGTESEAIVCGHRLATVSDGG